MSGYEIRKATKEDCEAIADLSSALNQSEGMTEWHRPDTAVLRDHLDKVDVYLAEADGRAVGFVACFTHFNLHNSYLRFEVSSLFVEENHRRKGIGGQLLRTLILEKKKDNILQFAIDVRPDNESARVLYEKMGFELRDPAFKNYRLGFDKLKRFYEEAA